MLSNFCIFCELRAQLHCLTCGYQVVPFVRITIPASHHGFRTLVENQLAIGIQIYFYTLNSFYFVYMPIFMTASYYLDICYFVVSFEIEKCESYFDLFLKIFFIYSESLEFPYKF